MENKTRTCAKYLSTKQNFVNLKLMKRTQVLKINRIQLSHNPSNMRR